MTPEEYREATQLFDQVRDLPEAERAPALERACAGKGPLRQQVERLLDADRAAGESFLRKRAIDDAAGLIAQPSAELPAEGTDIGNYRLGNRIGIGGMGVVYSGQDRRLDRRVAIKILPSGPVEEGNERIARFQREARSASLLNHPNIVSIFEADFDRGFYYIATEFIEGKTLRQLLAAQPNGLDGETVLDIVGQTASALRAAHEAGIVHRDIKPENIMVRPDGFVKVLDFGLAKLREPESGDVRRSKELRTQPGRLAGTVQYLSPEQVIGKPADARSDLFSLGVVAYELATGARAFDGPTEGAVFDAILHRSPLPPSAIRASLGVELDSMIQRLLEKDPELRFQTASDLRSTCQRLTRDFVARALNRHRESTGPHSPASMKPPDSKASAVSRQPWLLWAMATLAIAAGLVAFRLTRPMPQPHVTQIVQITTDDQMKQRMVNDGIRLYYATGNRNPEMKVFQLSLKGGDPLPMPRLTGMLPLDISPDRSEILLGQILQGPINAGTIDGPFPIWVTDTLGRAPRRLGDLTAQEVRWSPKGDQLLLSNGSRLQIADADGSQPRDVIVLKGLIHHPEWSPDGRTVRFTLLTGVSRALWEVAVDGSQLHEVFPDWSDRAPESGVWTPDGKYYVFTAGRAGARDLWAVRTTRQLFETAAPPPVRLTSGPMKADLANANLGGPRIFFMGSQYSGELIRYNRKSRQWMPYFDGLPAMQLDFSRDGKWIVYTRCPDGSVWRMAMDGSERTQLTAPPLFALNPRWSPDGSQIAFSGAPPGETARLYVVPAAGGAVRQLTHGEGGSKADDDANWSPDGSSLVFGVKRGDPSLDIRQRLALQTIDLRTQRISNLAGTEGLWSPRLSPDGRYVVAMGFPNRLWLYEMKTGVRTQLTKAGAGWPSWYRDSSSVYFKDDPLTGWYRVRIENRQIERVAGLAGLKISGASVGWVGTTPDGTPISTRETGGTQIYAIDWDAP